jgi:hypothetical protein
MATIFKYGDKYDDKIKRYHVLHDSYQQRAQRGGKMGKMGKAAVSAQFQLINRRRIATVR